MKKIILLPMLFLFSMWSYGQYSFPAIPGPINVPGTTAINVPINDAANSAGVPAIAYDSFTVSVDWVNGYNAYSSEADLTVNTVGGSVKIDPPTSGGANNGNFTTLTFSGDFTSIYNPSIDGTLSIDLNQSWSGTNADWSNIVVTLFPAPTCPAPTALSTTGITTTSADISWTAGFSETNWNISWGTPGYTPGDSDEIGTASSTATAYHITGLAAETNYDVYVQANCGSGDLSTWTNPLTVFTGYCIPTGASNNSDEIRNFTLSNLNNDSGASEGIDGYSDYSGTVSPALLSAGVSYVASLTSGSGSGNHGAAIWIDLNNDLIFDVSEMVAFLPNNIGANTTVDFPAFSLPASTPLGTYRLRVQYHYFKAGDLLDPCILTSSYSETEDYAITVQAPPSCLPPTALATTAVGANTADISWVAGDSETNWNISWGTPGYTPGDTDEIGTVSASMTSYQISGLAPQTTYDVYVQADCGGGDESTWTGPLTLITACDAITAFPYEENFDGSVLCWNVIDANQDGIMWSLYSIYGVGGSTAAGIYTDFNDGNNDDYLVSPQFILTGNERVRFSVRTRNTSESDDFRVVLSSTGINPSDFNVELLPVTNIASTTYEEFIINLDQHTGAAYIAIHIPPSNTDGYYFYVDDFVVETIPSCPAPTALILDSVTATTADISWTAGFSETNWNISWGTPGFTPGDSDELGTASASLTSYQIAGLAPQTTYDVYVQADCGGGDESTWTGPLSFTTDCVVVSTFYEDFETTTGSNLPNCWSKVGATGSVNTQANTKLSGSRVLYVYNNVTVALPTVDNASAGTHQMAMDVIGNFSPGATIEFGYLTDATDASSFISISSIVTNSTAVAQEFVTIPVGMPVGDVVFAIYAPGATSSLIDNVRWEPIPSCLAPTALILDSVTATTADISWTAGDTETNWNISWGTPGYTPGDTDEIGTASASMTSYQISGLAPQTAYDVYVQADCGGGDESTWTGPLSFTTDCVVVSTFYEDFETTTGSNLPNCWSKVGATGSVDTRANTKLSGSRVLYVYNNVTVALPTVDNASAGTHQMAMDVIGNISPGATIEFGYLTNATDASSFISISSIVTNSTAVAQEFVTIPVGMPTGDVVFAIYAPGGTSSLIDNVRWEPIPSCPAPTALILDSVTAATADISWTAGFSETNWNISWGTSGYTPGDSDEIGTASASMTSYQISGLAPQTTYDVYVQADCGGSDMSTWVGPVSFTTSCVPGTVPFAEGFENSYSNDAPLSGCWSQENGNWRTFNESSTYGRVARTGDSYVSLRYGNDDWIYYPLNLTGGTTYTLSFYARQDASSGASVKASFGTSPSVSAMTNEILPQTDVTSDTYMEFSENFTPNDNGVYYIGINGTVNYTPWYLTIDDISVTEATTSGYVYENGAWSPSDPSGISTSSDNIYVIDGLATINVPLEVKDIHVMSGATLRIENVLHLHGDLTVDGELIFGSTPSGNGELAAVSATSTITGEVTVEHYMKDRRSYRMVSSAVTTTTSIHDNWQEGATSRSDNPNPGYGTHITGTTIDQTNGFDGTQTGNASMYTVDVSSQTFQAIANTDVNTLTAGDAYLMYIRGDRTLSNIDTPDGHTATTLRARGQLVTGNHTQTFPTTVANQFVMFGNPYQSAVDINDVFANSVNVNTNQYYVYDVNIGDYGNYVTVNLPAGTNPSGSSANQYLQAGQAAQFATLSNGPTALNFMESAKAPGNYTSNNAGANGLMSGDILNIQLYTAKNFSEGGSVHDGMAILFDAQYSNSITATDAPKAFGFGENIARDHNGTYLSIERREMPVAGEVYSLYTAGYNHQEYVFKIDLEGVTDVMLYLDDNYTGTSTLLQAGVNTYSFEVSDALSQASDRFSIRTESLLNVDDPTSFAGVRLYPNPLNAETFYVHAPMLNGKEVEIRIADISGRQIYNRTLQSTSDRIEVSVNDTLSSGVYLVTIKHAGEFKTYRLIRE